MDQRNECFVEHIALEHKWRLGKYEIIRSIVRASGGGLIEDCGYDGTLLSDLFRAWKRFAREKMRQNAVRVFWMNLEGELLGLYHDIVSESYAHGPYRTFTLQDTKRREIAVASVRDRVVHHLVSDYLSSVYAKIFYPYSYASQRGKGIDAARWYVFQAIGAVGKLGRSVWIGKLDIRKFFATIHQETLLAILSQRVKDSRILWLCRNIIESFRAEGRGLPLGNLTSQWFGNIYLNDLDWHVRTVLHAPWYMRYSDDMIIVDDCEANVRQWIGSIRAFVADRLRLEIPLCKIDVVRLPTPIDVLGIVTDGQRQWLRSATRQRAEQRLSERFDQHHERLLETQCSYASIGVYGPIIE